MPAAPGIDRPAGGIRRWSRRPSVAVTALLASSGLVTLASAPRWYVGDDRFEKYFSPGLRLLRELSLWDAGRGLGRVREDFWPGPTIPVALLRGLGASPATAEHLWHAVLIIASGLGVVALLRLFRPKVGVEHAVAGLVYMFNPVTATLLVPSGLFFNYAIAPWLLAAFVKGVRDRQPWRWAAAFALLVFLAGDIDAPGLLYAMVPIVPMAVFLVHVERTATWRRVLSWLLRAGLLSALAAAAALVKLAYGAGALSQRLATTESPKRVNLASSWTESWRGLGFWLSYFRDQSGAARPQGTVFFRSVPVVIATFAVPCGALAAAWRTRWRPRLAFLGISLLALVLMVGAFPIGNPSPYGRALLFGYARVPGLSGLRNSYKAGGGLMIGLAVLVGVGAAQLATRRRLARVWTHAGSVALGAAVLVAASLPFWTGKLYAADTRLRSVPSYWTEAATWLDRRPGDDRVLVLPGSTRTAYRWGWTGDDILDALIRRPHVVDTAIPLSTPEAANLVAALSRRIEDGTYEAGELAPVARRLGVGYVLVRNDLDWRRTGAPRPERLDSLRRDPGLRPVAAFGRPGQNVTALADHSLDAAAERQHQPLEIYAVDGVTGTARSFSDAPPLLIAGDGEAWPSLAQEGLLDSGRAVTYAGDLSNADLRRALAAGSPVILTDTNRRRLVEVVGPVRRASQTLGPGEDLDRPTPALFRDPKSQSVAVFGDATSVTASSIGTPAAGFQPWLRPANAFDGNEATAWEAAGLQRAVGSWLRVKLRRIETVSQATLVAAPVQGRRPTHASIHFSDGSAVPVDLSTGRATVSFRARRTSSLEIRIDAVGGPGLGAVGFAEVSFPGLDLSEQIQLPEQLVDAARADGELRRLLTAAPLEYDLLRSQGGGPQDEEPVMHRRMSVAGPREFAVDGALRLGPATPDHLVDLVVGGPSGAWGTSRYLGAVNGSGEFAVDGREETGWLADPRAGGTLNLRFPMQAIHRVDIDVAVNKGFSRPTKLTVTAGAHGVPVEVPAVSCPPAPPTAPPCVATASVTVPTVTTDHLTVRLDDVTVASGGGFADLPVNVLEVRYHDQPNLPPPPDQHPVGCVGYVVSIDKGPVTVGLDGTVGALLAGDAVPFRGCRTTTLESGVHRLDTSDLLLVDQVRLRANWPPPFVAPSTAPTLAVLGRGPTEIRAKVDTTRPVLVTNGQSYDKGWRARLDGKPLGRPRPVDTLSAWNVPHSGVLEMRYEPQRWFSASLVITAAALALCLWLLTRRSPP